jgi:hypothetical protein
MSVAGSFAAELAALAMSVLPPIATENRTSRLVRFVPIAVLPSPERYLSVRGPFPNPT